MYELNQMVAAKVQRCACVGGGFTEVQGRIVNILHGGQWYQIDQPNGIVTVKLENIIKAL